MLCHWFNWSILACRCFVSVSLLFFISGGEFTSFVCEAGESKNVFFPPCRSLIAVRFLLIVVSEPIWIGGCDGLLCP